MNDSTNAILRKAYEFIENDELEQAQSILAPLLETDAENPSVWWVYSHAVRDRSIGQLALDRAIALDPSYPGASELRADVLELQDQEDDLLGLQTDVDGKTQTVDDIAVDDWEDLQPDVTSEVEPSRGRSAFVLPVLILLIIATGAALVASGAIDLSELLSGILPTPEPVIIVVSDPTDEPAQAAIKLEVSVTAVAEGAAPAATAISTGETDALSTVDAAAETTENLSAVPETEEPALEPTMKPTLEPALAANATATADQLDIAVAIFVRDLDESISEFEIKRGASDIESTELGETLVLQICVVPGREFNERLNRVMNAVAVLAEDIPAGIDAMAAGLLNCPDPNASLRMIGVAVSAIAQYASQDIDAKEFQRAWQPLS